jgi:lambda repressor-like predicted transcriptional regulator
MTGRYYPLEALVAASGLSEAALARRVGLSGTTLKNARVRGLREDAADRYAIRAGLVPWLVWSDWLEDTEVECADERCQARFVPSRVGHRFCSRRCQQRFNRRERYRSDPDFAERCKEADREYQASSRRATRLRHAAYRAQNRESIRRRRRDYYLRNREELLAKQRERDRRKREDAA